MWCNTEIHENIVSRIFGAIRYAAATINAAIHAKAYECLTLGACLKTVLKGSQ